MISRHLLRYAIPCAALVLIGQALAPAQTSADRPNPTAAPLPQSPSFEVISIKEDKTAIGWNESASPDGYRAKGITFMFLVMEAYDIRPNYRIIGAPAWWNDTKFDIEAKVSDSDVPALQRLDWKQRSAMIQQILTDRFKLKAHREVQTQPVYSLVVAKPGLLTEASPSADGKPVGMGYRPGRGDRAGQMVFTNFTMNSLAAQFSGILGRMVTDSTGLTGIYHGDLHFTNPASASDSASDPQELSIFTALQEQLGLKLVPTKGPVECLVIDHIEKPAEN